MAGDFVAVAIVVVKFVLLSAEGVKIMILVVVGGDAVVRVLAGVALMVMCLRRRLKTRRKGDKEGMKKLKIKVAVKVTCVIGK